jgi:hypothetical protein
MALPKGGPVFYKRAYWVFKNKDFLLISRYNLKTRKWTGQDFFKF